MLIDNIALCTGISIPIHSSYHHHSTGSSGGSSSGSGGGGSSEFMQRSTTVVDYGRGNSTIDVSEYSAAVSSSSSSSTYDKTKIVLAEKKISHLEATHQHSEQSQRQDNDRLRNELHLSNKKVRIFIYFSVLCNEVHVLQ